MRRGTNATKEGNISYNSPDYYRDRRAAHQDNTRINSLIRAPKVRLVDDEGNQLGVVDTKTGLEKAKELGLDLVEVSPNSDPPVCRIMDYSKYKYEQEKKRKQAKKKQHVTHIKEVRFKPSISEHDYQVKLKHIKEFLANKDKVRVSLMFKGREMAHKEFGMGLLNRLATDVAAVGEAESSPKMMGRMVSITIIPKNA
jgi:translation initiation factor IF-3